MGSLGGIPQTALGLILLGILILFIVSLIVAGPTYVFGVGAAALAGLTMPSFGTWLLIIAGAIFLFFMFVISQ